MPDLNAKISESFVNMAKQGLDEAQSAFLRTFGTPITLSVGTSGPLDDTAFSEDYSQKGLALVLLTGGQGIAVLIPYSGALIPFWCDSPDATGKSKLSTFAQEWGMNLVPDDFFPEDFLAGVQGNLYQATKAAKIGDEPGFMELTARSENGEETKIGVVWPLLEPNELLKAETAAAAPTFGEPFSGFGSPPPILGLGFGAEPASQSFSPFLSQNFDVEDEKNYTTEDLPGFSRSLLKVKLPVAAVLARARKPIKTVLELGVGSIVQFDKSCDELIELEIDKTVVANGEAVKVGEKFGLRINTILLPQERFRRVEVRREGEFKKAKRLPQIIGKAPIKTLEPNHR